MKIKKLSLEDRTSIIDMYHSDMPRKEVQKVLSEKFDVSERTIRNWAKSLGVGVMSENVVDLSKILVYDIETSRVDFKTFWTGKQYVGYQQMRSEPTIISVSWKWLGSDKVKHLTWDMKTHSDAKLMKKFLKVYNKADLVVGYNNNNFDNRWINARAMKHNLFVNVHVKSFDIIKHSKRLFRIPSYSMAYLAKYIGVTLKQSHEGILMWDMIEDGNKEEQAEYMQKMIDYNVGDIVTTEEIFLKLRKYMGHTIHIGTLNGGEKFSCPHCGGLNVELYKVVTTAAGTLQYIMKCNDDDYTYKLSQRNYNKFLEYKVDKFNS